MDHTLFPLLVDDDGCTAELTQLVQIAGVVHMGVGDDNQSDGSGINARIDAGLLGKFTAVERAAVHGDDAVALFDKKAVGHTGRILDDSRHSENLFSGYGFRCPSDEPPDI